MLSQNLFGATGGAMEPASQYVFVVYDRSDGSIHHIHHVVNLPGAEVRSREQMEQTAVSYVPRQAQERATGGLAVLNVQPQQLERGKFYRVDHQRQALVAEERRR
jgi:hypothetical protein